MPGHLRALVVILVLAIGVFTFAKAPACAVASTTGDFERRRNLWFGITLVAFLANNFWIYIFLSWALLGYALSREANKMAMYFFLLFAVPPVPNEITGLGIINYFFSIDYVRLLALVILLPSFWSLWKQPGVERFGVLIPDKLLAGYMVLQFVLIMTASTFTNTLRVGVFYQFIDIFLPYFVASRYLRNLQGFKDALMGFLVAGFLLSAIGMFEYAKHWLLYAYVDNAWEVRSTFGGYLERGTSGGELRAMATTGHAIVLGYVIAVAFGFFLYLRNFFPNQMTRNLGLVLVLAGMFAPLSRGPWVGAAVIWLLYLATSASPGKVLFKAGLGLLMTLPILLATSLGEKIIDLLPFTGSVQAENVTFRARLVDVAIRVILQNPFFGAFDYIYSPQMQELKEGGIIDIVNTYIGIALSSGLVGLSLFAGFFAVIAAGIFSTMRKLPNRDDERYVLGQALLSTLIGIMVIIGTVSSVWIIPVVYWLVAGLGVAYARMMALAKADTTTLETAKPARF